MDSHVTGLIGKRGDRGSCMGLHELRGKQLEEEWGVGGLYGPRCKRDLRLGTEN